jgi:NAD(P)-dependent dehydrogenase (short-subunit alcohol dehydrogenase family)
VNTVAPSLTDTEIHERGGQPGRVQRNAAVVSIGRAGAPEEIAEMVLYMMSEATSYVTASVWRVWGGR